MFFEFQNFSASKLGFIIIQPSLLSQIQRRHIINLRVLAKLERLSVLGRWHCDKESFTGVSSTGLSLAMPALLTIRSQHLNDDFPLRTPLGEVGKRIFCFLERKHLVDHWPDAFGFEKFADFAELGAIGVRKEK